MAAPQPVGFANFRTFYFILTDGTGQKFWQKASFGIADTTNFRLYQGPTITSVTGNGTTTVSVLAAEAHGFVVGQSITLHGFPNALDNLNGNFLVTAVADATHFSITRATALAAGTTAVTGVIAGVDTGAEMLLSSVIVLPDSRLVTQDYPAAYEMPLVGFV